MSGDGWMAERWQNPPLPLLSLKYFNFTILIYYHLQKPSEQINKNNINNKDIEFMEEAQT